MTISLFSIKDNFYSLFPLVLVIYFTNLEFKVSQMEKPNFFSQFPKHLISNKKK